MLQTVEIGLLLSLIAGGIGVASFFFSRKSAAKHENEKYKNEGEWRGKTDATLMHISSDVRHIKDATAESIRRLEDSVQRAHDKIDSHIRNHVTGGVARKDG